MRNIKHIVLVIFLMATCAETTKPQETNDNWRHKYGILKGKGAIGGVIAGRIPGGMTFEIGALKTEGEYYKLKLNRDQKFMILNLDPGLYRLVQKNVLTLTLLDSIPVVVESITELQTLNIIPDSIEIWNPPPVPMVVIPTQSKSISENEEPMWQFRELQESQILIY
ncbi:hypothetical protein H8E88_27975 [candidate division KSB1 bacterium]|nr:hypothetical protein [candidate division KSB1 bacterium]